MRVFLLIEICRLLSVREAPFQGCSLLSMLPPAELCYNERFPFLTKPGQSLEVLFLSKVASPYRSVR